MHRQGLPQARIPSATYRLQFNAGFTFDDATALVGYLSDLGISDLYASSYLQAKLGSIHGYDVVNQTLLNREVGDEASYQALVEALQRHGMGQILDFVPNHMCVESEENLWWMDVLENGPSSLHAHFFDIDWAPVKKELTDKVLLPFLGDQYGRVLERGELRLSYREGAFAIDYYGLHIPVEPKSTLDILVLNQERLQEQLAAEDPALLEYFSIVTSLQHLPGPTEQDQELKEERHREKEIVRKRLDRLCREAPQVARHLEENLAVFNGSSGDPHSFDLMDRLLQQQCYRLSFWRVATEEINYRRFFDINGLAAIRMEDPAVFQQTHQLLFRLIREGKVSGVRIDHVDGLYDPLGYLEKLQESCYRELTRGREDYREVVEKDPGYRPLYAVVEKILMKGEQLPKEWPVFGSTGYDFLNQVNGIFVDSENGRAFDRIYDHYLGYHSDFTELMYEKKKLVLQVSLSGEANMLGHRLNNISERDRLTRDFTLISLVRAISEVIACFPVYRTYVIPGTVRERDVQYIEAAVTKAKRKNPAMNASVFDFLHDVLLLKFPDTASETDRLAWLDFAMHFQQITGPVMAKGLEDTTFYVYNRLASLNEVGGMPGRFGTTLEAFHGQNLERLKSFPHAMITTATHDTKRGEDVRTRIDALSEIPDEWEAALVRWSKLNRDKEIQLEGMRVPTRHKEYLLYQTLLGAWPLEEMDPQQYENFLGRIKEYLIKASREAKTNTSWISPNQPYEEALLQFVDALLAKGRPNEFLDDFIPFQKRIARFGLFNSLSQVLLKMVSPGCPDFYQGTELWDFTLVDPDNRRPVDYQVRLKALSGIKARERDLGALELVRQLVENRENGWIKLYLIYRVLNFRRDNRALFEQGDYLPLEAQGARAANVCAFLRSGGGKTVLAAVPRMLATLAPEPAQLPLGEAWLDSLLLVPDGQAGRYRSVLTGEELETVRHAGRTGLPLARVFASAPVALLEKL